MAALIATSRIALIVGLGVTGFSVARFLARQGRTFMVADKAPKPESLARFQQQFPGVRILTGEFDYSQWQGVSEIILSPGVPRKHPAIAAAIADGVPVIGDIELFTREARAPIVAITGSNGKTTVTTLVGEMAKKAGVAAKVGGNLGTPALDLLDDSAELYVLELSSFQLESTVSLRAAAATVLNVSPDHMDRYKDLAEYHFIKQRIYMNAQHLVINRDDALTQPPLAEGAQVTRFGLGEPDLKDFGLHRDADGIWLAHGLRKLLNASEIPLRGLHNLANALAALALGRAVGLDENAMLETLREFPGLPHRCQLVGRFDSVDYVNDSKGTNIGATEAALKGLASDKPNIVLIAGGDGKGADFSSLAPLIKASVRAVTLIGKDADKIAQVCAPLVPVEKCSSLQEAVEKARKFASPGDTVLLSPACASLDMFRNYEDRGDQFRDIVERLCAH
ncbi:UDP-N-acetylmuramoyl-L-alanine--D-glutamate ligase [Saccharophagus sp. K07]|uniref:UDP-N-acetylmuramoyl-L-alanine--D-glutamate ligase n=1 Tax=Saccharophagus sp. K07 TaxID=2283636 RepID=UPI0016529C00|nr:UDP-N-acetylmuramoyl-L-alanine--D-glutamate ligase [Saccharophagus sp. K07]MBC6907331.1 UDP-N-acetylmuramoyl-L-alanine--D-glutamate ligase [Saccharophagus sp. K07]